VGPISPLAVSPHKREVIGSAPEWCAFGYWDARRSSSRVACCSALFLSADRRGEIGGSWQYVSSIGPPRKEAAGCSGAGELAVCQLHRTQR
jgi:hypothetical protein